MFTKNFVKTNSVEILKGRTCACARAHTHTHTEIKPSLNLTPIFRKNKRKFQCYRIACRQFVTKIQITCETEGFPEVDEEEYCGLWYDVM